MASDFDRFCVLAEALAERAADIRAAADGAAASALLAEADSALVLIEEFNGRAAPIVERMAALAADVLGPDWLETPSAPGSTPSADQRSYAHRDERRR